MADFTQGFEKNTGFGEGVGSAAKAASKLADEALDLHKVNQVRANDEGLDKGMIAGITKNLWKGDCNHLNRARSEAEDTARAERVLDRRVDRKEDLSLSEKRALKQLEHSILEGKPGACNAVLRDYKDNPRELSRIMHELRSDMKEQGLIVSYSVGQMGLSPDYNMHDVGMMRMFRESGGRCIEMSTEPRLGANVGGPVKKQADGTYIDYGMGLSGSPADELADMGRSVARRVNGGIK